MSRLLIICFFLLCSLWVYGQEHSARGKVLNLEDNQSIPYASIYIKHANIGTISNEQGDFVFHIPDSLLQDTLHISAIGFGTFKTLISDLLASKDSSFYLSTKVYFLDEIMLFSEDITPEQIFEKALERFDANYSNASFYLKCFYRELSFEAKQYTRLIEAAVDIQDYGFKKNPDRQRIKVREIRKSEDFRELSWASMFTNFMRKDKNNLFEIMAWDFVRNKHNPHPKHVFADKARIGATFLETFLLKLEGVVNFENQVLFKVYYGPKPGDKSPFITEGHIYINRDDYGIVRMDHQMLLNRKAFQEGTYEKHSSVLLDHKYLYKNSLMYRKYGTHYFLSFMQHVKGGADAAFIALGTDKGRGVQGESMTLLVNEVITDKKRIEKIKRRDRESEDKGLYEKDSEYNEAFWTRYNQMLMNQEYTKAKKDLEKEGKLEKQFKENGQ